MAASEDFIDTFYHSIGDLHSVRESLNKEYSAGLKEILKRATKDISNHTGKFLHTLKRKKPDENTLQRMISASPSSLSYMDKDNCLPIQSLLLHSDTVHYVPLLAKEGVKHKVGGNDGRGGLLSLLGDNNDGIDGIDTLTMLGAYANGSDDLEGDQFDDKPYVDVMKELREANLFTKDDIRARRLLYLTCCSEGHKQRFEYICDWCPEGLKGDQFGNLPFIHAIIINKSIKSFAMFLKASIKHYEKESGLLFETNDRGITACERAFQKFGKKEVMQVIGDCIPFDDPQLPILHHVAKHAPQLLNNFSIRYTSAIYVRDEDGRNLNQAMLASGKTLFKKNGLYFLHTLTDDHVREIDPVTDLYPFMVAASGNTSDLSAVYVLLRRNPSLVRGGNPENAGTNSSNRRRRRRRSSTRSSNSTKRKCSK